MGLDTLEEEQEKNQFFTELEAQASSTIDYAKLNRDLDSTSSTSRYDMHTHTHTHTHTHSHTSGLHLQSDLNTVTISLVTVTSRSSPVHVSCVQTEEVMLEGLKVELLEKEKLIQKLKQDLEEVNALKQQNYVLQSKLHSAECLQKNGLTSESRGKDKLQQMDKEMREQETLIQGYQQENERLYQQMKFQQARNKATEDAMFKENQKLLSELASTREQLDKALRPVSDLCSVSHAQRITHLLDQVSALQRSKEMQREELQRLRREKQSLEVDLQLLRDRTRDQDQDRTKDRDQDQILQEEVMELRQRLQWFTENQELLGQDSARLRAATAEIRQLKEQVKELEQILRSRNPNSLPALIFAAASAQDSAHLLSDPADPSSCPSRVTELLERKVQRLEAELEAYDEDAKRSLRAMEQQFQATRMCYEQRISELEQKREEKQGSDPGLVQSLREELRRERDAHRQNEIMLQNQLSQVQQQMQLKSHSSPSRHQRQADAAFRLRMERLNQELSTKSRTIQDLTRTVERLQRERRSMLSVPVPRAEGRAAEEKRPAAQNKSAPESDVTAEMFPALNVCEKTYQPTTFTDSHVSELHQENATLRQKLQQVQEASEREKADLRTTLTQTQAQISRSVLMSWISQFFMVRLCSNKPQIKQLQEQLSEAQSWRRALTVSQAREDALQTQLSRCLDDLKEARDGHSPEVKLLWTLEKKVQDMERRQQHRDREVHQMIGAALPGGVDLQMEVERWKRLAQNKTRELDSFRLELDSILDIIRHLQRQGVVLPAPPVLPAPLAPPL
ncbi:hypothetical protein NQD34_012414, partial [Periophthalmus magnuspinnatus]